MSLGAEIAEMYMINTLVDEDARQAAREKAVKSGYWTQRDGKKIAVSDMTDDHIANTIKMLESKNDDGQHQLWIDRFIKELGKRKLAEIQSTSE